MRVISEPPASMESMLSLCSVPYWLTVVRKDFFWRLFSYVSSCIILQIYANTFNIDICYFIKKNVDFKYDKKVEFEMRNREQCMRKVSLAVTVMCLICVLAGCGNSTSENPAFENPVSENSASEKELPQSFPNIEPAEFPKGTESADQKETEQKAMSILMKIDDEAVTVAWEDNDSVAALTEFLREQPMSIQMSMYGGFEQVGSLGTSLPRDDKQTTTQAGDIVLYSGNQMVVFYGSNSWAYTRLGKVTDKSDEELMEMLGSGDVTITLELVS